MNPPHHLPDDDSLEKLVHANLRALPPRRAPASLERRVMAELARRAARPWWRQSYAHWPFAARALFLVVSAAVAALAIILSVGFIQGAGAAAVGRGLGVVHALRTAGSALVDALVGMLPAISSTWLYAIAAGAALAYASLVGLGAAAYRVWRNH